MRGEGKIEQALGADTADVLRVRFLHRKKRYEITYLWRSEFDNYASISGYVYQPGFKSENPGMEVLFIDQSKL